ncbi:MAG: Ig-like domain-containing protein [Patescibacteria group bacterium]
MAAIIFNVFFLGAIDLYNIQPAMADSTFTVNDLGDATDAVPGNGICATAGAVCTLRAAVVESNALGGSNTINFSVAGTIDTASSINITNGGTTIDGGVNHDVVVNGNAKGHHGFYINNTANNVIKGLVLQDFNYAIYIYNSGATGNKVQNNYIGTNSAGDAAVANNYGVVIYSGALSNYIGTDGDGTADATERNVISGNTNFGVYIVGANSNRVAGNYIGLNAAGNAAVANAFGIMVYSGGAQFNIIGTNSDGIADTDERNVISGNSNAGVRLNSANTNSNTVAGNYIGINSAGTAAVANQYGVVLTDAAQYNIIGTNGDGIRDEDERNIISGNIENGVQINAVNTNYNRVSGNYIGLNPAGTAAIANNYGMYIIIGPQSNIIGTNGDGVADADERNIISGNTNYGILMLGANVNNNRIAGNYIGVNPAGTAAFSNSTGINITQGPQSNIIGTNGDGVADADERNIISGNTIYGVGLSSTDTNFNCISNNYIGLNAAGDAPLANGIGIINLSAPSNIIGTNGDGVADADERNIISGNTSYGILISNAGANSNRVSGNYIGLNAAGNAAFTNGYGVVIREAAQSNIIGTNSDGTSDDLERNIISGNTNYSVYLFGANTSNNTVKGNYIGVGLDGITDYGNSTHGIKINSTATSNTIGGSGTYDANIIAYNGDAASEYGISIEDSGTDLNKVTRNSIHDNQNEGIKLTGGSNDAIAVPSITGLADGGATATIALSGTCLVDAGTATIELFESDGSGEGETYITSTTSTDGNWNANITGSYTQAGKKIVATVTSSTNNTSQFSSEYTITDLPAQASTTGTADSVNEEDNASLVGTNSYDPNSGDSLTYLWERTAGESIIINNADQATANFDAPDITGADSSVTVRLTVNGGDTDSKVVNIINTNDAPILSLNIPDQSLDEDISENAKFDLDDYFTDTIPPGDTLTYTALDGFNPALGTMDINIDGTIDFNLAANANGSDTIQFRATDDLNETADSNILTVTIDSINDAPTFSGPITVTAWDEDTDKNLAFDLDDYFSDIDAGDSCAYSIPTDPVNIDVTIDIDNKVSFSPDANWNGNQTAKFRCTDLSLEIVDSNDITLTVNNVNDEPTASAGSNQTVVEDIGTLVLDGSASSDIDIDDILTYEWAETLDAADACGLSHPDTAAPSLVILNKDTNYSCEYRLIVNDGTIDSTADFIMIYVEADNDAPTLTAIDDKTVDENEPLIFSVGAIDADTAIVTLQALDENNDFTNKIINVSDLFADNGNNTGTFDWTPGAALSGNYQLTIDANDGNNYAKEIVNIAVNDTYPDEEPEPGEISYLTGSKKGPGIINAYTSNGNLVCSVNAFDRGGAIGRLIQLANETYITAIKRKSGTTIHVYDDNCQMQTAKKLSPKLHVRRMAIKDVLSSTTNEEIIVSARRNGHVMIKMYNYRIKNDRWILQKRKSISGVPHEYRIKATKNSVQIFNKNDKLIYTWKIK